LLIEVHIVVEAEMLLKAICLSSCHPVFVERHSSLNSCREGITIDSLDGMSDEAVEPCLMSYCVLRDYRL